MSFIYGIVLHDKTPLAEFPQNDPEISSLASNILFQLNSESPRLTAEQGNYLFTTLSEKDRITYICVSDKTVSSELRNTFMNQLQQEWRLKYGSRCSKFAAHEKDAEFGPVIQRLINKSKHAS